MFAFFVAPLNLAKLTPPDQHLRVVSCSTAELGEGTLLEYQLRVHGVPLRWRSLIRAWEPPQRFIDEQLVGPFRSWVHEHSFEELASGETLVRDHIDFTLRGGRLVERLFVRRNLRRVFDYRRNALVEHLGARSASKCPTPAQYPPPRRA